MLKNVVKKWRLERKISKADLARRIGVCRSYVTKLELGSLQPSGEMMFRIAEYFKLRVEDVFQREGGAKAGSLFFGLKLSPKGNDNSRLDVPRRASSPSKFTPGTRPQTISPSSASALGRS
jgi:putative transcriptional regulator